MEKNKASTNLNILVAVICLTLIQLMALYVGMNGQILSIIVAAIASIVGYEFGVTLTTKKVLERIGEKTE